MATYLEPYLVYIWLCVDVRSRARMCAVVRSREQMCANARRSARMYPDMRSFGESIRLSFSSHLFCQMHGRKQKRNNNHF